MCKMRHFPCLSSDFLGAKIPFLCLKKDWHIFFSLLTFSFHIFLPSSPPHVILPSVWDSRLECLCVTAAKVLLLCGSVIFRCNQTRRHDAVAKATKYTMKELHQSIRVLKWLKSCDFYLCLP